MTMTFESDPKKDPMASTSQYHDIIANYMSLLQTNLNFRRRKHINFKQQTFNIHYVSIIIREYGASWRNQHSTNQFVNYN